MISIIKPSCPVTQWQIPKSLQYNFTLDREQIFLKVLQDIQSPKFFPSNATQQHKWESGWQENLEAFRLTQEIDDLIPKYNFSERFQTWRHQGRYIQPVDPHFGIRVLEDLLSNLFARHGQNAKHYYEIGAGSCYNLTYLAQDPVARKTTTFHALDWTATTSEIVTELNKLSLYASNPIQNGMFNLFDPFSRQLNLFPHMHNIVTSFEPESIILTCGALEQIGEKWQAFLEFLFSQKEKIQYVIHIEPFFEGYQNTLFDYIAAQYHQKRNYLRGYFPKLREMETKGEIEILKFEKTIGTLMHDGWTQVVWRFC